jgi:hypothetical protein
MQRQVLVGCTSTVAKICIAALMAWVTLQSSAQTPVPNTVQEAHPLHVISEIKGLDFTLYDNPLPRAPGPVQNRSECENYVVRPVSAAGRLVAARGWAVTGDEAFGTYRAVSFAGKFEPSTSAHCSVEQGNIGIFNGTKLLALAYAPQGSEESIGKIVTLEDGGLRVWSGDILSSPIGDIHVPHGELMRLGALAAEDSFCHSKVLVPNIYGQPIDKARRILMDKGWKPVASKPVSDPEAREAGFVKHGIVEVDSCAGTGYAFCAFNYKSSMGLLSVTTAGEGSEMKDTPNVVDYHVRCR